MTRAWVGLGSNVGDRWSNLSGAVESLRRHEIEVIKVSSVYETDPVGPPQPMFLNAVAAIETALNARELHAVLKQIERDHHRTQGERWGPRELDLDLLIYGGGSVSGPDLTVPHPELENRQFVLVPLLEVSPGLVLPSGAAIADVADPGTDSVRKVGPLTAAPGLGQ